MLAQVDNERAQQRLNISFLSNTKNLAASTAIYKRKKTGSCTQRITGARMLRHHSVYVRRHVINDVSAEDSHREEERRSGGVNPKMEGGTESILAPKFTTPKAHPF